MKLNLEEQEETIEPVEKTDLIYGIDDRPPFKEALFAALQHLLAIFVAIITPPLIIAGALKLDLETTGFLVSMALFASGVSTFIQCRRIGPVGAKLLCIQGTSFSFIGPIITAGLAGGLPLIFGACIAAAPIEMVISRTFKYMRSIITPLVSGIVVLLIGLSLIKVGVVSCGGGYGAMDNGTFGSIRNIGVAATVLLSVLFFNRCKNKYLAYEFDRIGVVHRLCAGLLLLGMVDMAAALFAKPDGIQYPDAFQIWVGPEFLRLCRYWPGVSDYGDRSYRRCDGQLDDLRKVNRRRGLPEACFGRRAGRWSELLYLPGFSILSPIRSLRRITVLSS